MCGLINGVRGVCVLVIILTLVIIFIDSIRLLYLLLLMVICDAQPPDLTTQQKECLFRVDAHNFHHLVYDLNSLKNVDAAYEYTDENDSGGKVDKIWDICDDLIEQVNYWYKDKHKSIVYGSSDIKEVFELYTYYWNSY